MLRNKSIFQISTLACLSSISICNWLIVLSSYFKYTEHRMLFFPPVYGFQRIHILELFVRRYFKLPKRNEMWICCRSIAYTNNDISVANLHSRSEHNDTVSSYMGYLGSNPGRVSCAISQNKWRNRRFIAN
jgi:hypothetical protein